MRTSPFLYFIVFLALFCGCLNQASATLDDNNIATAITKLDALIKENLEKNRIPGCSVAIVYRNQIVFLKGYGVRTLGRPDKINEDTVFQLGSVSKPIAATLASMLETKGLLRLDDPVNKYLPFFTLRSKENPKALKVKNLLSHTSGIPRGGFNNLIESYTPFSRIVDRLQSIPVRIPVGKKYDYHNAMFSVISAVTEAVTHQSFEQTLFWNLLQPLNMTHTTSTLQGILKSNNRASPHSRTSRGRLAAIPTYSGGYYTVSPAGGINSSARDMGIFLNAQMGGYPKILDSNTILRTQQPQVVTKNILQGFCDRSSLATNPTYGLGWRLADFAGRKIVFHGGWLKGFTNFIAFLPEEQIGIVILHNADTRFSSRAAVKFLEHSLGYADISNNKNYYEGNSKKSKGKGKNRTGGKKKGKAKAKTKTRSKKNK